MLKRKSFELKLQDIRQLLNQSFEMNEFEVDVFEEAVFKTLFEDEKLELDFNGSPAEKKIYDKSIILYREYSNKIKENF